MTNTPSFGVPNAALGATTFGTVTTTANAISRQFQFALKVQKRWDNVKVDGHADEVLDALS